MPIDLSAYMESARRRLRSTLYWAPGGYRAERFWKRRHLRYQFDLRGVGNSGLSHDQNAEDYRVASETFLDQCHQRHVDFARANVLDIGCGMGHYTGVLKRAGVTRYLGLDITDALFPELTRHFPDFAFRKLDITKHSVGGSFDLVLMIDVTQHITNPLPFSRAMRHVKAAMASKGLFVVTSWLDASARKSFYEVSRSLEAYRSEFAGFEFGSPVAFRDKFLFTIRKA